MYIPTSSFLQLPYSILLHDGKALTFASISHEDSVLFVWFHFTSVHFGVGLIFFSSAVQEFGMKRSRISPSIQTSISTLSAANNFIHRACFFQSLSSFLIYSESCPASLQMLLLQSLCLIFQIPHSAPRPCFQTVLWRGPMSSPLSPLYPVSLLQRCETEKR